MLFVGDQVIYEGSVYRVFKVNGDIINIANDYSEAEAFEDELTVVYEPDFEPFDYGYMLDCERTMLREMYDFFTKESVLCDKDDIGRHIGLAFSCFPTAYCCQIHIKLFSESLLRKEQTLPCLSNTFCKCHIHRLLGHKYA